MRLISRTIPTLLLLLGVTRGGAAEVFELVGGGRVEGVWVNREESPRRQYVVSVAEGSTVAFAADQVERVDRQRPEETEYEGIRPTYADTPEAQWELAQWCRDHRLVAERESHLRRIIELSPEHVEARRALGYSHLDGEWVTRDEVMEKRGYQRYKGEWKLPQEIELLEGKRQQEASQQEWYKKIRRWRSWIGTDREEEACASIREIDDPVAVRALIKGLTSDKSPIVRMLYIEALAKIDTAEAARAMAIASLSDPVEEVRLTCLDHLEKKPRPEVVSYYVGRLNVKKSDNATINLAAIALGRLKAPSSVGPLIESLVTVHKFKVAKPGGDGAMTTSFGTGPGGRGMPGGGSGMSAGGGPSFVYQTFSNQAVLDALIAITGQNFNFDKQAWKYWQAAQKRPPDTLDGRRD